MRLQKTMLLIAAMTTTLVFAKQSAHYLGSICVSLAESIYEKPR
jgi:hypothetical protein